MICVNDPCSTLGCCDDLSLSGSEEMRILQGIARFAVRNSSCTKSSIKCHLFIVVICWLGHFTTISVTSSIFTSVHLIHHYLQLPIWTCYWRILLFFNYCIQMLYVEILCFLHSLTQCFWCMFAVKVECIMNGFSNWLYHTAQVKFHCNCWFNVI